MDVVLYLRYSSERQTEQSIEGQDRVCTEFCARRGLNIVGRYIDRAASASKRLDKRKDFLRMIDGAEKGAFDGIVVYKLDRFARNRYDSAIYKARLRTCNVCLMSATEEVPDAPEGIIMEALLEGIAEYYSAELSQKVKRGMHETAMKCHSCGGTIPLGYRVEEKKLVPDEVYAPIVAEIYARYAGGETITGIVRDLNARGLGFPGGRQYSKKSFHRLLTNEKYIGVYKYGGIRIEGGMPAIVSREVYDKVQERISKKEAAHRVDGGRTVYLLTGKIFCGHCGSPMVGDSGTGRAGKTYHYYTCAARKNGTRCDKKSIRQDVIESAVIKETLALLTDENIDKIARATEEYAKKEAANDTRLDRLEEELRTVDASIENLVAYIEKGNATASIGERLQSLEAQKEDLKEAIRAASFDRRLVLTKEDVAAWLRALARGDISAPGYRRHLVDALVERVTVWDDPDGGYKMDVAFRMQTDSRSGSGSDGGTSCPPDVPHPNTSSEHIARMGRGLVYVVRATIYRA